MEFDCSYVSGTRPISSIFIGTSRNTTPTGSILDTEKIPLKKPFTLANIVLFIREKIYLNT